MISHFGSTSGSVRGGGSRRHRFTATLALAICIVSPSLAQQAPAVPTLPNPQQAGSTEVRAFITSNLALLSGSDIDAAAARQALLAPLSVPQVPNNLTDNYALNFGAIVLPKLGTMSEVGRLNTAIVAFRIGSLSESTALAPLVTKLLQDPSPAVVLWAARAAGQILPGSINSSGGQDTLLPAIDAALVTFQAEEPVVRELYSALSIKLSDAKWLPVAGPGLLKNVVPPIVTTMQKSLTRRLSAGDVLFESSGLLLVLDWKLFPNLTPQQQDASLKLAVDGITRMADITEKETNAIQRRTLVNALQDVASSLSVIAKTEKLGPQVVTATNDLRSKISAVSPPGDIQAKADATITSIHAARPNTNSK